ncbi:hypothetical protein SGCZBJ_16465 [Caulobacter zeae]|uniref:Autotransporter domain-containing protein n=1 Tax=Caulobacter zeae TaxID=2055137 RepID=A0A2N5DA45_9CAUL|nr:autotransporter outer membrane beta-barrel domain-containing protein [Caulobacter zeae]PLR22948.1 hypothetical protein SGCZBJ_16465 [Caulobacter zeae]
MAKKQTISRLAQAAALVDQLIHAIDTEGLSRSEAASAAAQVLGLVQSLSLRGDPDAAALKAALGRLAERLALAKDDPAAPEAPAAEATVAGSRFAKRLKRLAMIVTAGAVLSAPMAAAARDTGASLGPALMGSSAASIALMGALPVYSVGDMIVNPVSGSSEKVVEKLTTVAVRTEAGNIILLATAVGDTFTDPQTDKDYEVTAVTKNADNRVVGVTVKEAVSGASSNLVVVTNKSTDIGNVATPPGTGGSGAGSFAFTPATGDVNTFADAKFGANGGNGHDGGGVSICIPLIGCATIAYSPSAGGAGQPGPAVSHDLTVANNGDIQVISDNLPGVVVSSVGGDGGRGGNAFGNIKGAAGGAAGVGGTVTLSSAVTIVTDGVNSHGIFAQSRSGKGGQGGTGYIAGDGGTGGSAGQGGAVTVTNTGAIYTGKAGAIGILAQSLGGAAGGGGDSYGIIGDAGSGTVGGNGGAVLVRQGGLIQTQGKDAHGVLAQSIGGSGGNAGDAGGIVTFGDTGKAGGVGGRAEIVASTGSSTSTEGQGAHALFAQSVGGGGGNGGVSIGLVALGSGGGAGGAGGLAKVTVESGASVSTKGADAHAIFAQSVGGGGGSAGVSGGLVALGAKGDAGGVAGTVEVDSSGVVTTDGVDSRGIFAQSVGGGGGAASGTGGLVSLGGSGAAGGAGGAVTVNTGAGGSVKTTKQGADAIFAQSVGGGGGSGASSGGVVALGGTAGGGGAGGAVIVTNGGVVETGGDKARGIFAQSVGGGGGSGGDGGGLVTIGGKGGAASTGGAVTVTNTGAITTRGDLSSAIQAQSVGGGGGDGGSTGGVFLTIGGGGNTGGGSGLVTVRHAGDIFTGGADSHGIFAQSVGGGGGSGGSSVSISAFAGVAIGGDGALGGDGGKVDIDLSQSTVTTGGSTSLVDPLIVTGGDRARGIFAQSVGGGGGNGGFAAQVSAGYGVGASAAVGGRGGKGGMGGEVDIDGDVLILTKSDYSEGLFAQSVGGGGGSGGFALSFAFAAGETAAAAFSLALGGQGGDGGEGGLVDIKSGGAILTEGKFSPGLVAQSVGGGGGNGGYTVSFAGAGAGAASASAAVGVGGSGGKGGKGGVVDVDFDGAITTGDDDAIGALIQSVGGGGGGGGFNVSGAVAVAGTAGVGASAGVGGSGGDGGVGDAATGRIGGDVSTSGKRSTAVIVQSVGGGGGSGGFNVAGSIGGGGTAGVGVSVGVGGSGGKGGNAGTATGTVEGDIHTKGDQSGGLLVQSVGGGGGSGGFNVSGAIGVGQTAGAGISVGVGGAGGGGGDGMLVVGKMIGDTLTEGADADGVVAQSIGGGGGSGGFNVSGSIGGAATAAGGISVGVGGSGGDGGKGGEVRLDVAGTTATRGSHSDAIIAQSVGGGGGSGGFSVAGGIALSANGAGTVSVAVGGSGGKGGDADIVTLRVNDGVADPLGDLIAAVTLGEGARAIVAQSVGGGGGSGGFSIAGGFSAAKSGAGNIGVGVGGGGEKGGDGKAVTGMITGDVGTKGADASGVLVQSVGGGGGSGGFNVTGGISASKSAAGNILVGVGGFGGTGGGAGKVDGGVTGDIVTEGDRAFGVSYQSLGGGGGAGAFNITGGVSLAASGGGTGTLGVGVGGFGGDGGKAGEVDAFLNGDVWTKGDDAHGVLLQSVGGGGGSGGFNITGLVSASQGANGAIGFGMGGFGGGGGDADIVKGVLTGDVTTEGDGSFGAMLQSLGGGGGNGGVNVSGSVALSAGNNAAVAIGLGVGGFGGGAGAGKDVTGTVTGRYQTSGDEADGVVAQSIGGGGGSGGLNVSGAVAVSAGTAGTGSVGIGGFGGKGGASGAVTLTRVGDTLTDGANSDGIIAQSVAGGGGQGGVNIAGGLSATTKGSAGSFGFGLGGFGGDGGQAGDVTASVTGNVWAQGVGSDVTKPEQVVKIPLFGGDFEFTIPADRTRLNGSNGVVAQSVGGGGGSGGLNVSGQLSLTTPGGSSSGRAISLGVGGFGGKGGDAGAVELTIAGPAADHVQVTAVGDDRYAAVAQSIGGGGGAGGINVSGGIALDGQLTAGVGGFGGDGGKGKDVEADVTANLFAAGDRSRGLMVQSIGGGGGAGGINISGGVSADTSNKEPSIVFGLGGFGGAGNISGDVTVAQDGQVWVEGVDAIGVLVQSVAGGGGSGGLNVAADVNMGKSTSSSNGFAIAVGGGGKGGTGADAGNVSLDSLGDVIINARLKANPVAGQDALEAVDFTGGAKGIMVQSIGGGGGVGGVSATGAIAPSGNPVALGIGGSGGSGGDAGTVTVVRGYAADGSVDAHLIRTFGYDSDGLVAQSIGGGGGSAGMNFTIAATVANKTDNPVAAIITVGGDGAGAGSGKKVDVDHAGNIVTDGAYSDGLIAQSVGGGGGSGNFNIGAGVLKGANALNMAVGGATGAAGDGGEVEVDHFGTIVTKGDNSVGLRAQSIGGGGGNAGFDMAMGALNNNAVSITIGRIGGMGGLGGDVKVSSDGAIDTTGADSSAIFAQSIGGGGGAGGSAATTIVRASGAAGVAVGGNGGVGAISGKVTVDTAATIVTEGERSDGVLAQSIGGGGGLGGMARTLQFQVGGAPSGTTTRTATVSVGGSGGSGAVGGAVEAASSGVIYTKGADAFGIRAQSIGGGGGIGGAVLNVRAQGTSSNDSFDLNIGGSGGTGGAGGAVEVLNTGLIVTEGRGAAGIAANSIGGGGGDGGIVAEVVGGYAGADKQSHRYVMNIGGSGGDGGTGGDVTVTNRAVAGVADSGAISTSGERAYGIFAQSLGGGGGNGSTILSLTALKSAENSASVGLNIGGFGGTGNTAGKVVVDNAGLIQTTGADAYGVLAQSIGGGGGNGGMVIAANILIGALSNAPLVSVGGIGGDGGDGGEVIVTNSGRILTTGARAHGIVAQSIGGGGGDAQMGFSLTGEAKSLILSNALAATVGAVGGGSGGQGGAVTVNHSGGITVLGDGAMAIKAESINGGGGTLGLDFSGVIGLPGQPYLRPDGSTGRVDPMIVAKAGAENVSGAAGGLVTVRTTGTFGAAGNNGVASFAQSIGGGGGAIDLKLLLSGQLDEVNVDAPVATKVQLALGGSGGQDVGGGVIVSEHAGQIVTTGVNTAGVLAQSVGGGGGRASGDVTVPAGALLGTTTLTLGGAGQTDAAGGGVSRIQGGAVTTTAASASGAILQSIGGGGGSAGLNLSGAGAGGATVAASLGAQGGTGLAGGQVTGAFTGGVTTLGDHALGLVAQSIGAGGGEVHVAGAPKLSVALGGTGGAAGDGGDVILTNSGAVQTAGAGAHGVFLQSVGGGGGAAFGGSSASTVALSAGGVGDGGHVDFRQTGDIVATGAGAYGVVAQSLGGGGGWVDGKFAGAAGGAGQGGAIDLVLSGQVYAAGTDSTAVFAQSLGEDGAGNIAVRTTGSVRGGSGTGAGVQISGGAANGLANTGLISAVSGKAIVSGQGDERVDNRGVVIGDIDLGAGTNAFDNQSGGAFMAFKTIDLRDPAGTGPLSTPGGGISTLGVSAQAVPNGAATFTNSGDFLMGLSASRVPIDLAGGATFANLDGLGDARTNAYYGARVINTVALDGHFVQTVTGRSVFDVAFGPYASDRVDVTGDVALAGTGDVTLTWLQDSKPVTLFSAGGSATDSGFKVTDTLAMDYRVQTSGGAVQLAFDTHFDQGFLALNERALGKHMNSAIKVGDSGGIGRLMALIGNLPVGQEAAYKAIFANLNPEPHLAPLRSQLASANGFSQQLFGCANPTLQVDGKCSWAVIERATADGERDADSLAVKAEGGRLRGGFEQSLDGGWSFATAVGYERLDRVIVDGGRSWSQGQGFSAGAGFKRRSGGAEMAFSLSGGWQWMETARLVDVFTNGRAESDPESGYVRADARFAYVIENGRLFVRPALNVWGTGLHQRRFEERGLDGMGARGLSDTQWIGTANPELTLGFVMKETARSQAAVSFTVGGLFNSTDKIQMPFQLIGANASSDPAQIRTALDRSGWRAGVDFHVIGDDRVSVKFNYTTEFGDRTSNQAAGLNLRVRF